MKLEIEHHREATRQLELERESKLGGERVVIKIEKPAANQPRSHYTDGLFNELLSSLPGVYVHQGAYSAPLVAFYLLPVLSPTQ